MGKKEALEYIDSKAELVTEVSDKIWGYAELSLMEQPVVGALCRSV
mgnify:CR=1 FL=1